MTEQQDNITYPAEQVEAESFEDLWRAFSHVDAWMRYTSEPEDIAHDNGVRAHAASRGLMVYAEWTRTREEPMGQTFADMMADLRHLADALGLDWTELDRAGEAHYSAELRGVL